MDSLHDLPLSNFSKADGSKADGQDPRLFLAQQNNLQYQKVETSKFLGLIPDETDHLPELVIALPCIEDSKVRIDEDDPTTRVRLAEIKIMYQVWIHADDDFVTIIGESKENLKAASKALQAFIDSINKDVQGKAITLTEHSIAASGLPVEIKPIDSSMVSYRPVTKQIPAGKAEDPVQNGKNTDPGRELGKPQGLVGKFDAAIREAAKRILPVEGELRVRAHMGVVSLRRRLANRDTFYDDEELKAFLMKIGDRGWSDFNHKLGDEDFAQNILEAIYQTEDLENADACKFVSADATILSIRDIKPKYCLILFAKNLRIEVEIKYEPGYCQDATAESIRGFACARRDKVVDVAVSCPDRVFDWHLAVESEASASRIPPEITHFVRYGIKFKGPVSKDNFLRTALDSILLRAANIDEVAGKVSWTFEVNQKPYRLEASVNHEWDPELLKAPSELLKAPREQWKILDTAQVPRPNKACGIMLYSREWDDKMEQINNPGGEQSNLVNGFPQLFGQGDLAPGIESFLQEIQALHEFTELAAASGKS